MGLTISWNFVPLPQLYDGMVEALFALTVLLQTAFGLIAIFVWDANSLWALVDVAFCLVAPFADLYWLRQYANNDGVAGRLPVNEVILFCLHTGYQTLRLWSMVTKSSIGDSSVADRNSGIVPLERLDLVWVTRSAALVSEIAPDIQAIWDRLVETWGYDYARQACRISIYCTSPDEAAVQALRSELGEGSLWRDGSIHLYRPDLEQVLQDYTIDLIEEQPSSSQSMLSFCGSPALAGTLHQLKVSTDLVKAITGHKHHAMEFHAESYGGSKATKPESATSRSNHASKLTIATTSSSSFRQEEAGSTPLSRRETSSFSVDGDSTLDA